MSPVLQQGRVVSGVTGVGSNTNTTDDKAAAEVAQRAAAAAARARARVEEARALAVARSALDSDALSSSSSSSACENRSSGGVASAGIGGHSRPAPWTAQRGGIVHSTHSTPQHNSVAAAGRTSEARSPFKGSGLQRGFGGSTTQTSPHQQNMVAKRSTDTLARCMAVAARATAAARAALECSDSEEEESSSAGTHDEWGRDESSQIEEQSSGSSSMQSEEGGSEGDVESGHWEGQGTEVRGSPQHWEEVRGLVREALAAETSSSDEQSDDVVVSFCLCGNERGERESRGVIHNNGI